VLGRAYLHGELACGRVELATGHDDDARLGLAPRERRYVAARFVGELAPGLRRDLEELADARGARGLRLAEQLPPLEFVVPETSGARRLTGRLDPPTSRNRPLEEIDFRVRVEAAARGLGLRVTARRAGGSGSQRRGSARRATPPRRSDMPMPTPPTRTDQPAGDRCARCRAPAVYLNPDDDEYLCGSCGCYLAGQYHNRAVMARDTLAEAIAELVGTGLGREHIKGMVDAALEGKTRPMGPDNAHPDDPRPWVNHLLQPINR
jgi:hypothetical protein